MESIVNWFVNSPLGAYVSREMVVFIISLFPILELRGGILAASLLDVPMARGILISAVGNFIPIPFILIFIKRIFAWMRRFRLFRPLVDRLERRAMGRRGQIERYEFIGLLFFVGIPLPMTGAWTGSLIAALLGMDVKRAIKAELIGIAMAACIMTILSYGVLGNLLR